jgi:hypothetical protein
MELLHTYTHREEKGLKETVVHHKYFFEKTTGQVTLVVTEDCDNAYPKGHSYSDMEIGRSVLRPQEIPPVVRNKIEKLMTEQ